MKFSREHNKDLLVKSLNEAVKSAAVAAQPDFAELWQQICINYIFANRRNGLIARVRQVGELSTEVMNTNLKAVCEAAAGAPILTPVITEVLTIETPKQSYFAALWPLANNRLVTPNEMAEVLHGIHGTPPPAGLPA